MVKNSRFNIGTLYESGNVVGYSVDTIGRLRGGMWGQGRDFSNGGGAQWFGSNSNSSLSSHNYQSYESVSDMNARIRANQRQTPIIQHTLSEMNDFNSSSVNIIHSGGGQSHVPNSSVQSDIAAQMYREVEVWRNRKNEIRRMWDEAERRKDYHRMLEAANLMLPMETLKSGQELWELKITVCRINLSAAATEQLIAALKNENYLEAISALKEKHLYVGDEEKPGIVDSITLYTQLAENQNQKGQAAERDAAAWNKWLACAKTNDLKGLYEAAVVRSQDAATAEVRDAWVKTAAVQKAALNKQNQVGQAAERDAAAWNKWLACAKTNDLKGLYEAAVVRSQNAATAEVRDAWVKTAAVQKAALNKQNQVGQAAERDAAAWNKWLACSKTNDLQGKLEAAIVRSQDASTADGRAAWAKTVVRMKAEIAKENFSQSLATISETGDNIDFSFANTYLASIRTLTSIGLDFIPGVGQLKSLAELITGRDIITREEINRSLVAAGLFLPLAKIKHLVKVKNQLLRASAKNIAKGNNNSNLAFSGKSGGGKQTVEATKKTTPITKGSLGTDIARTFRSGTYTQKILSSDTMLYRVISETGNPAGSFWTRVKPTGSLQSVIDYALDQKWGNTATKLVTAKIPRGTKIFEGVAAKQGQLAGGGNQIYIPKVNIKWIL